MNALDIGVLAVLLLSAIFAFARGFVRETLSIVAWVGAAAITVYGFNYVYGLTIRFVKTPLLADLIAGAGLFLASLIILTILTGLIARLVHFTALTPIDRTLGLIFGLARGAVLVSLAYLLLDISVPAKDRPAWINQAKSEPALKEGAAVLRGLLPKSLQLESASAGGAGWRVRERAKEARDAMDALSHAAAPLPPKPEPDRQPSYKPAERRDLDRLINNAH